jgi:hypothetical protein
MKKSDRNLLLAASGAGLVAYLAMKKPSTASSVSGIPGVGALLPSTGPLAKLIPDSMKGQPSPVWLDAAVWGGLGLAAGYYGLAGRKLF